MPLVSDQSIYFWSHGTGMLRNKLSKGGQDGYYKACSKFSETGELSCIGSEFCVTCKVGHVRCHLM